MQLPIGNLYSPYAPSHPFRQTQLCRIPTELPLHTGFPICDSNLKGWPPSFFRNTSNNLMLTTLRLIVFYAAFRYPTCNLSTENYRSLL